MDKQTTCSSKNRKKQKKKDFNLKSSVEIWKEMGKNQKQITR